MRAGAKISDNLSGEPEVKRAMQPDEADLSDNNQPASDVATRRAHWDRVFWQAANGRTDPRELAHAVLHSEELCAVLGESVYVSLVEWASVDDDDLAAIDFSHIHEVSFPRPCFCRRHSPLDYDEVDFSKPNVYRRQYYGDECITQTTAVLFRRTEDIDLLRCTACGDLWLRGMDQDWGRTHFLLLEADDLSRIERDGIWPDGLDRFEDDWVKAFRGIPINRNSPDLADWQAAHNTPEAMQRFGRRGR
jgi:hypothetical protein